MFREDLNRHYSLRKLTVGLASVLIGLSFAAQGRDVKADAMPNSNQAETQKDSKTTTNQQNNKVLIQSATDTNNKESNSAENQETLQLKRLPLSSKF